MLNDTKIDALLTVDWSQYSTEDLLGLYIEAENMADQECYNIGIEYNIK